MTGIEIYSDWLASVAKGNDVTQRARLGAYLVDCEEAHRVLRANGYGQAWMSIADVARAVLDAK